MDPYAVLNIPRDSSPDDAKRAFRKLAAQNHPDKFSDPVEKADAEKRFKEINAAYREIVEPNQRGVATGTGFGFPDIDSFFGDGFFSMFRGGGVVSRGPDAKAELTVSVEDSVVGCDIDVEFVALAECAACHGDGTVDKACHVCEGSGKISGTRGVLRFFATCGKCGGRGALPCVACGGRGTSPRKKKVKIAVPGGVCDGSVVRAPGAGHAGGRGFGHGDLYVEMRVAEHATLSRNGPDIVAKLDVTLGDLVCGREKTVSVPGVGAAFVTVPPMTRPGMRIVVKGAGAPDLSRPRGERRGDLVAVIQLAMPDGERDAVVSAARAFDGAAYVKATV